MKTQPPARKPSKKRSPSLPVKTTVSLTWLNSAGVMCPTCGSRDVHFLANQKRWKCRIKHERQQFSVKVGTVMEDSPISLTKWLPAMWMIANCKNGISSYELHRALGVTQKTAWFMLHRVRLAMQDDSPEKLSGKIEADETFIGGSARFMHKSRKEKTLKGGRGVFRKKSFEMQVETPVQGEIYQTVSQESEHGTA
jgi:transposase-like protein